MQPIKFRLHFTAPLHVASRGVGFEQVSWVVHSDTLYSAIITVWSQLDAKEAESIVNAESPPFLLSSAFPYQDTLEFYPKPLLRWRPAVEENADRKQWARVQFIEAEIFRRILHGEQPVFDPACTRQRGHFWISPTSLPPKSNEPIIYETEVPRVVIDRLTNQGMNYFVSELRFADDAGLFFWARFLDPAYQDRFTQVLRVLGDEGLGLDRTSGKGLFKIEDPKTGDLPGPPNAERFLSLSLYTPAKDEIDAGLLHDSGYELVRRSGYVFGYSFRRQTLTMFAEGSLFSGKPFAKPHYGVKLPTLDPDFAASAVQHQVYRYGYAFPIGFHHEVPS